MERRLVTTLRWACTASILCGGFLAGCGGGGGGGGSAAPPPAATAPTITTQPQTQTVTTGSAASFTVAASGSGLSYQWNRNGTAIAGATSATYTIQSAALSDSGVSFTVVVSNSGGQVTSSAALLTANANPEGLYTGTLTNNVAHTTLPVFAIVLKDGTFEIFATESNFAPKVPLGISISGAAKVVPSAGNFSVAYTAYTQPGYTFTNGQAKISGTMSGAITPGTSITGTYASSVDNGSFTLNAVADYGRASSTATIAGTYHYSYVVGNVLIDATTTINADGTATVSDTAMCSGPSMYSVPDATHNAYKVTNSAQCPTAIPPFVGLAAFFPANTGAALNGGVNFTTDTLVAIADNGNSGLMVIGSK